MAIGPRKEIFAKAEEPWRQRSAGHLYGKTENGGTGTLYVSPVPFDQLDRCRPVKVPGEPGLGKAERRMAATDGLGKAVLAAPALGIAAGVAGAFVALSKRKERLEEGELNHVRIHQ